MLIKTETLDLIRTEMDNIPTEYHKPFSSNHEGYAVLQDQVDSLWEEVKTGKKRIKSQLYAEGNPGSTFAEVTEKHHKKHVQEEAVKVAAMAIRIIQELTY